MRNQIIKSADRTLGVLGVAALIMASSQVLAGENPFASGNALPRIAAAETGKCGDNKAMEKAIGSRAHEVPGWHVCRRQVSRRDQGGMV